MTHIGHDTHWTGHTQEVIHIGQDTPRTLGHVTNWT